MKTGIEKFFCFVVFFLALMKISWKSKWKLRKWKNKAMVNSILGEWQKVKQGAAGDGGRSKKLNFLSILTGNHRFF